LIITDDNFTSAAPRMRETEYHARRRLLPLIESGSLIVTQGFIGATSDGRATTLGRGGSDYSAAILGAAIGAEAIEIWTDVDGMMTADPRIVPGARRLDDISYDEAAELSWFGAKVLHPSTVTPAVERNIPLRIYNTRNPSCPGTRVIVEARPAPWVIKSIALKRQVATLNVAAAAAQPPGGFVRAILDVFDGHQLQVDLMSTSSTSASFAVRDAADLEAISRELRRVGEVTLERNKAMVLVVGDNLKRKPWVTARLLMALDDVGVSLVSQGATEISLVCVIDEREAERAVRLLHDHFFDEDEFNSRSSRFYRMTWSTETSDRRVAALQ
jgi:aspartate kinase